MTIDLYTADTSNGQRAAIMLEECGLAYTPHKLDLAAGEQREPEFSEDEPGRRDPHDRRRRRSRRRARSPSRSRARSSSTWPRKTGRFIPRDARKRAKAMEWVSPGDDGHGGIVDDDLRAFAPRPEKSDANLAFCEERTLRHLRLADAHLAGP